MVETANKTLPEKQHLCVLTLLEMYQEIKTVALADLSLGEKRRFHATAHDVQEAIRLLRLHHYQFEYAQAYLNTHAV